LNHAPLFLSIIGGGILLLGILKKNHSLTNLSLYLLVAAAICTIPVFLTGEGTEEMVEHLPGTNEGAIEQHEDMAKIALIIIAATGFFALFSLVVLIRKASLSKPFLIGVAILSLASFGAMAQTAHLGGLIKHSELRNGTIANEDDDKETTKNLGDTEKKEKDDDD
ncbi:MAG: hypothetical protein KDB99_10355, partial [Chitinophagaceae bacterium]|nr:hypothetical protein [Chitinophagaceae bacterium]